MIRDIISTLLRDINEGEAYAMGRYLEAMPGYKKTNAQKKVPDSSGPLHGKLKSLRTREAYEVVKNTLLLTLDDNQHHTYEERTFQVLRIQRDILCYDMMRYRGVNVYGSSMVKKQLALLEQIECYDLIVEILNRRKKHVSLFEGNKEYKKTLERLEHYELCRKYLNDTIDIFLQCSDLNLPDGALKDPLRFYQSQLRIIFGYYEKTESKQIIFYLLNIKQIYDYHIAHPSVLLRASGKVMKLLDGYPEVFGSSKRFFALLNLAYAHIKNLQLRQAFETLKASEKIDGNPVNKHLRTQLYFTVYLYSNGAVVPDENEQIETGSRLPAYVNFKSFLLDVSLMFIQGKYKEIYSRMKDHGIMEEDREGWHFYHKLLHIMVMIELECHDEAALQIERFRKQIERGKKPATNYPRWQTIKKIMVNIATNSFNFKRENLRKSKNLEQLKSMEREYRWVPGEAELIPFHAWYESKTRLNPYDHAKAMEDYRSLLEKSKESISRNEMDELIESLEPAFD